MLRDPEFWEALGLRIEEKAESSRSPGESGATTRSPRQSTANLGAIRQLYNQLQEPAYAKYKDPLTRELMYARQMMSKLGRVQHVLAPKHMELDEKTMSTLRQIVNPVPVIHDVMVAFFLLLGEYEGFTRVCSFSGLFAIYLLLFGAYRYIFAHFRDLSAMYSF